MASGSTTPTFRSGPNQYLNTFDPAEPRAVEVLRGAGSVQYGSDALGGVVHLLTRRPPSRKASGWAGAAW
jgi:iron complex outermembrane receptor protein/hemoglobin/transferrin/lactoferrin receptor protein